MGLEDNRHEYVKSVLKSNSSSVIKEAVKQIEDRSKDPVVVRKKSL